MDKENEVLDYIKNDQFARHSGIEMIEITTERVTAKLRVEKHHLNGVNIVHGGVIFTLADLVFGVLGYVHDRNAVSINASISYFKAVKEGTLFAEGRMVTLTPKLGSYTVHVSDEKGEVVAVFQGLGYRRQKSSS